MSFTATHYGNLTSRGVKVISQNGVVTVYAYEGKEDLPPHVLPTVSFNRCFSAVGS